MPSEFNHIDDFFRRKEEEASADSSMQDRHWQQMKDMLVTPAPPSAGKIRTLNPKLLWQLLIGCSFVAVIGLLVWKGLGSNNAKVQADNASKNIITREKDSQSKITTHENTIAADADSQKINKPVVWNGDFKINFPIGDQNSHLNQPSNEIRAAEIFFNSVPVEQETVSSGAQLASFFEQLKKPEQEFVIYTERDTTIFCNENTSIFIPANSFRKENGIVTGSIRLTVREFYEMADIIGNKLATASNGQMLATGGMLHIEAIQGNDKLVLKTQSYLKVEMPTKRFDPDMQLFYGTLEKTSADAGHHVNLLTQETLNWNPAAQKQFFYDFSKWTITVTDYANDPRDVVTRRGRKIAKFILSDYSSVDLDVARAELQIRHGMKYDEIKLRRGWKRETYPLRTPLPSSIPSIDGMVGESISLTLRDARKLGLISSNDSAWHIEQWKKQVEKSDSMQRQLLQVREQYSFSITNLGWINCDKFLARQGPRTRFIASTGEQFANTYFQSFLIFKDMNSIIRGSWFDGKILFEGMPVGKRVTLVCVGIKDGKAYASWKETNISPSMLTGLEFEETTPEKFRESLKKFGNVIKG